MVGMIFRLASKSLAAKSLLRSNKVSRIVIAASLLRFRHWVLAEGSRNFALLYGNFFFSKVRGAIKKLFDSSRLGLPPAKRLRRIKGSDWDAWSRFVSIVIDKRDRCH